MEPGFDMLAIAAWIVFLSRARSSWRVRPPRSRMPRTAVLPTVPPPSLELLGLVLVLFDAADIRLVNLNDALELLKIRAAGLAEAMQNKPRRLLRDADFLRELHGRNALARRHKEIHRVNPLMERHMAALENRPGPNRKILFAGVAAIIAALARGDAFARTTDRAARAVRPKPALKIDPSGLLIWEHREQFEGGNRALGHRRTPAVWGEYALNRRGS